MSSKKVPVFTETVQKLLDSSIQRSLGTYVDVSLLVPLEQVVHDGTVMKVFERRHIFHPCDAAVMHGLDLLPGESILFVGVHLQRIAQNTHSHVKKS